MTKKDYELIASAILTAASFTANGDDETGETMKGKIAVNLANALQAENSRFDRRRFLKACGIEF